MNMFFQNGFATSQAELKGWLQMMKKKIWDLWSIIYNLMFPETSVFNFNFKNVKIILD